MQNVPHTAGVTVHHQLESVRNLAILDFCAVDLSLSLNAIYLGWPEVQTLLNLRPDYAPTF